MMIRDSEICPVFAIIILCPILTEMIRVAGEELDNDSNEKKLGLEPSMNSRPPMVAKSKSEVEPSSRAIFLRPPTQLTQEDLELIEQRVEIKVNLYFVWQNYYFTSFSLVIPSFSNHYSPFTHFLELTYVVQTRLI